MLAPATVNVFPVGETPLVMEDSVCVPGLVNVATNALIVQFNVNVTGLGSSDTSWSVPVGVGVKVSVSLYEPTAVVLFLTLKVDPLATPPG